MAPRRRAQHVTTAMKFKLRNFPFPVFAVFVTSGAVLLLMLVAIEHANDN